MSENLTRPADMDPEAWLDTIEDPERREDYARLLELMRDVTGEEPRLWGGSMVGFGSYRYRYASGRQGDWFLAGFAPRKRDLTIYLMSSFDGHEDLVRRLGRHRTGKSCLYVKRLADLDEGVLRSLIAASVEQLRRTWPEPA